MITPKKFQVFITVLPYYANLADRIKKIKLLVRIQFDTQKLIQTWVSGRAKLRL